MLYIHIRDCLAQALVSKLGTSGEIVFLMKSDAGLEDYRHVHLHSKNADNIAW